LFYPHLLPTAVLGLIIDVFLILFWNNTSNTLSQRISIFTQKSMLAFAKLVVGIRQPREKNSIVGAFFVKKIIFYRFTIIFSQLQFRWLIIHFFFIYFYNNTALM
jgi:hypothetical protein